MNLLCMSNFDWFRKIATVAWMTGLMASFVAAQTSTNRTVVQVSAAKDGTTFGVLSDQTVVTLLNGQWNVLSEKLTKVSVGAYNNVWGINSQNQLMQLTPTGWEAQPGSYKDVAAASDGAAIALDSAGNPYEWHPFQQALYPMPNGVAGGFSKVAIGNENLLYALNAAGTVFKYHLPLWKPVKGKFKEIFVSADGIVTAKDYQNVSFSRTDAAVDLEIQQNVVQPQSTWIANPSLNMPELSLATPVVASKSVGFSVLSGKVTLNEVGNSFITVDKSETDPSQMAADPSYGVLSFAPSDTIYVVVNDCASFTGALNTDTSNTKQRTIIVGSHNCLTGKFTKVSPSDPTSSSNQSILPGPYFATAQASAAALAKQLAAEKAATAQCPASKKFYTQSAHSWVQFSLPQGAPGQKITIPQGAYNNYVFPTCNRVWWDQLQFACKDGTWTLPQGQLGADGYCTGWAGANPYYTVGNR